MESTLSRKLLTSLISIEGLLEGQSGIKFDIKHKILFLLQDKENCSPNYLITTLNIARSNLAIICNKLAKSGLIQKNNSGNSKKEITYNITESGRQLIENRLNEAGKKAENLKNKSKILKHLNELEKLI